MATFLAVSVAKSFAMEASFVIGLVCFFQVGCTEDKELGGLQFRVGIGDHPLNGFKAGERPSKGLSLSYILRCKIDGGEADPCGE